LNTAENLTEDEHLKSSLLLTGIGLRAAHYADFLEQRPAVAWLEVHSENFFGEGGKPLHVLETLRRDYPVSIHGVGLSIGSADDLNWEHLRKLRDLSTRINPCLISDHLSWSSINGQHLHDLLPLPYTEEALQHVITRIQQIQEYLQRQILIENISSYLQYGGSTIPESEFITEVAVKSGCGILLDVNNIYVSARNLGFEPTRYIASIPPHLVQEIHLAGFSNTSINGKEVLIDSHNNHVAPEVWNLYQATIKLLGRKATIIEWDSDLPPLDTLYLEAYQAEKIMRETYVPAKRTG
jgi:uncharacterized protein (UPF0276 family)